MSIANKRINSTSSATPSMNANLNLSPRLHGSYTSKQQPQTHAHTHGKNPAATSAAAARPRKNSSRTSSNAYANPAGTLEGGAGAGGGGNGNGNGNAGGPGTRLRIVTKGVKNEGVGSNVIAVSGNGMSKEASKVQEPYIKSTRYILKKYSHLAPSITVHLHSTHFRFDGQDGSFPYTSEMRIFLQHIREGTVPHDMMEQLLNSGVRWYEDCLVVRVVDHKSCGKKRKRSMKNGKLEPNKKSSSQTDGPGDGEEKQDDAAAATSTEKGEGENANNSNKEGEDDEGDESDELEEKERERLAMTLNSVHNYNQHVSPSPYVPFPFDQVPMHGQTHHQGQYGSRQQQQVQPPRQPELPYPHQQQIKQEKDSTDSSKTPASSTTAAATSKSPTSASSPKPRVFTTVLHPTAQSRAAELIILSLTPAYKRRYLAAAAAAASARDGEAGGESALPSTTLAALSATSPLPPQSQAQPPLVSPAGTATGVEGTANLAAPTGSQRQRMLIEPHKRLEFEAKLVNATAPPVCLHLVKNANEARAIVRTLEPETNQARPPSPKIRKRTVAELAADEAHAAEEERFMLIMDQRLDVSATSASLLPKAGSTTFDSETAVGPGFAFARFKALEAIRAQHEENKKKEQAERAAQEAERKNQQREAEERRRIAEAKQAEEQAKQEEKFGQQFVVQQRAAVAQMAAVKVQQQQQAQQQQRVQQQLQQQQQQQPPSQPQQQAQRGQTPSSVSGAGPAAAQNIASGMSASGSMRGTPTPHPASAGLAQTAAGGIQASPMSRNATPQQHTGVNRRGSAATAVTAGSPGVMPSSNHAGIPPGMTPASAVAMGLNMGTGVNNGMNMNVNGYPMGVGVSPHGGSGASRSTPVPQQQQPRQGAGAGSPLQPGGQIGTPTSATIQHHAHPTGNLNTMGHAMMPSRSQQSATAHGHPHGMGPAAGMAMHGPNRSNAASMLQNTPAMSQATPVMRNTTPIQPMNHASPRTPGLVQGTPGMVHPGINANALNNPALANALQMGHLANHANHPNWNMMTPQQQQAFLMQQQHLANARRQQQNISALQHLTPVQLRQLQQRQINPQQFTVQQQIARQRYQQQQQAVLRQQQQQQLAQQLAAQGGGAAAQNAQGFPAGMRPNAGQMNMVAGGLPQGIPHGATPQQLMANGVPASTILLQQQQQRQLQARQFAAQQAAAAANAAAANGSGNFMPAGNAAGISAGIPNQIQMNAMSQANQAKLAQSMLQQHISTADQEQAIRQVQQQQQQQQQQHNMMGS